jgi:hypothetical protein
MVVAVQHELSSFTQCKMMPVNVLLSSTCWAAQSSLGRDVPRSVDLVDLVTSLPRLTGLPSSAGLQDANGRQPALCEAAQRLQQPLWPNTAADSGGCMHSGCI